MPITMATMLAAAAVLLATTSPVSVAGSSSSTGYGSTGSTGGYVYASPMAYLPAPPGKRPKCAGYSDTFCEYIDYYPTELIEYLLKRYSYDYNTLLQDETSDIFRIATSPAAPYSAGTVYVPGQSSVTSASNASQATSADTRYDNPALAPYVGTYGNFNEPWWSRYLRPSQGRQYTASANRRVTRQALNDDQLCPTTSQFIMPKAAVNTKGNWMFVVNLESNNQATQLVKAEKCATTQCSGLCQVPAGFASTCQQQFVQKRLVALNGNGENLYTDTFWFPHCCTCQIRPING